jgi:hypothetical protein
MDNERGIPGPFTIDEWINRQISYELAVTARCRRYDHLDTGWTLDELWEIKESFKSLEDF